MPPVGRIANWLPKKSVVSNDLTAHNMLIKKEYVARMSPYNRSSQNQLIN
jgi:hypothetical protein